MDNSKMPSLKNLQQRRGADRLLILGCPIEFAGISVGLALLHLVLIGRLLHQVDAIVMNALFWLALLKVFMDARCQVKRDRLPRFAGHLILGLLVVNSLPIVPLQAGFVRLFPVLAALSLSLLFGLSWKQHWRMGLLFTAILLPRGMVEPLMEQAIGAPVRILTAQFAAFVLHYLGFAVAQQDATLTVNHGAVEVLFRCTGLPLLVLLLQLVLIFFGVVSLSLPQQARIVLVAVGVSFLLSGLRVALMATVVRDPAAFEYWHGGSGSQIFSTSAIVLLGGFCQQFLPIRQDENAGALQDGKTSQNF